MKQSEEKSAELGKSVVNSKELIWAAKDSNMVEFKRILKEEIYDVNHALATGSTALHMAARNGNLEMINCLLDEKANIDSITKHTFTPLYIAVTNNQPEATKLLLRRRANLYHEIHNGDTILTSICERGITKTLDHLLTIGKEIDLNIDECLNRSIYSDSSMETLIKHEKEYPQITQFFKNHEDLEIREFYKVIKDKQKAEQHPEISIHDSPLGPEHSTPLGAKLSPGAPSPLGNEEKKQLPYSDSPKSNVSASIATTKSSSSLEESLEYKSSRGSSRKGSDDSSQDDRGDLYRSFMSEAKIMNQKNSNGHYNANKMKDQLKAKDANIGYYIDSVAQGSIEHKSDTITNKELSRRFKVLGNQFESSISTQNNHDKEAYICYYEAYNLSKDLPNQSISEDLGKILDSYCQKQKASKQSKDNPESKPSQPLSGSVIDKSKGNSTQL